MNILRRPIIGQLSRSFHSSQTRPVIAGAVNALLHGSQEAQEEAQQQHSKVVGRGKWIHEFQKHRVLPQHVEQYKALIADYYKGINDSSEFHAKLLGSWEIVVGEVDTFVHIWEYEGLPGFEITKAAVKESKGHLEFFNHDILPLVQSRTSQLNQEFNFWQSAPPEVRGGIYELRTYTLKPGALLEWEHEWRVGLEARLASGHKPVGAWFSQIGKLHQVHHMWHYPSLEERRLTRQKAWEIDTWSGTVSKTVKLTTSMEANVLRGLPFSPTR
ncbi:NIPSNAP-domain-containing protein [Meredithblackwellia eburnea MCA 4105]